MMVTLGEERRHAILSGHYFLYLRWSRMSGESVIFQWFIGLLARLRVERLVVLIDKLFFYVLQSEIFRWRTGLVINYLWNCHRNVRVAGQAGLVRHYNWVTPSRSVTSKVILGEFLSCGWDYFIPFGVTFLP